MERVTYRGRALCVDGRARTRFFARRVGVLNRVLKTPAVLRTWPRVFRRREPKTRIRRPEIRV